jgi:hypothetical protein
MTWFAWRQHRIEGLILLIVLAVIGVFLLVTGLEMANSFQQFRLSNCLGQISKGSSSCYELGMAWNNQYGGFLRGAVLLLALPLLLGGWWARHWWRRKWSSARICSSGRRALRACAG